MSTYAKNTDVSSDRSLTSINRTLARYGAEQFMYGWSQQSAVIAFEMNGRRIKFNLPMPDRQSREFTHTPTGKKRVAAQVEKAYEQAIKQKWRALDLVIKAKLEAVESGITEFEEEFLAHIVLPNGSTVGQFMLPQIETAYETGDMPTMLPAPKQ